MGRLSSLPARLGAAPARIGAPPKQEQGPAVVRDNAPWRSNYKLARWKGPNGVRLATFKRDGYVCQMCGRLEGDTSKLTCDHRIPHRGDEALFWDENNLQTLCTEPCHVKHKQAQEQDSRHHVGVWT